MKQLKHLLILSLVVFSNSFIFGTVPAPVTGNNPACWPPPCVPIDNGIILLMIAGAAYAAKKIYDRSKRLARQS